MCLERSGSNGGGLQWCHGFVRLPNGGPVLGDRGIYFGHVPFDHRSGACKHRKEKLINPLIKDVFLSPRMKDLYSTACGGRSIEKSQAAYCKWDKS